MKSLLTRTPASRELCSNVWSLLVQQLRFRNRPNLKNPLPLHYNRARMEAVCKPIYPKGPRNCEKQALNNLNKKENPLEDNPYAIFLAGKLRRDLAAHPMVAVFHTNNYTQHEMINIRGSLYDMNFGMKIQERINRKVATMSLTNTRWSPILHLLQCHSALGFCSEVNVPNLMKALKKMPQFVLLALILDDRILHRDAVTELERLRDITNVRAQLCSTLALQSVTLSQNLTANINALSHSLGTYAIGDDGDTSSSSSDSDDDGSSSSSDSDKE